MDFLESILQIKIEKCEDVKEFITKDISDNIIDFMNLAPNGVLYMSREIDGLVQTSANNGILKEENGNEKIYTLKYNGDKDIRKTLFKKCVEKNITIIEMKKKEVSLEDAFLKITEEGENK